MRLPEDIINDLTIEEVKTLLQWLDEKVHKSKFKVGNIVFVNTNNTTKPYIGKILTINEELIGVRPLNSKFSYWNELEEDLTLINIEALTEDLYDLITN